MAQWLWIIEVYDPETGKWYPRADTAATKKDAKERLKGWRLKTLEDHRIRKYVRKDG